MTQLKDEQPRSPAQAGVPERIQTALQGLAFEVREARDAMTTLEVASSVLYEALQRLRDRAAFDTLILVTAVDRYPAKPRFEIVYQLLSTQVDARSSALSDKGAGNRIRVRSRLSADSASVRTVTDLWAGAAFSERECYDMFGVTFEGEDPAARRPQRRLLMPEEYDHHPLRKDFPHQGIEPDRLYREWDRQRRKPRGTDR